MSRINLDGFLGRPETKRALTCVAGRHPPKRRLLTSPPFTGHSQVKSLGVSQLQKPNELTLPTKTVLLCRDCGDRIELVLNLPAGVPPKTKNFQCRRCAGSKSMLDVENADALIAVNRIAQSAGWYRYPSYVEYVNGRFAWLDRYAPYRRDRKRKVAARSRQRHPERDRARRWRRTSGGLFTPEEWEAKLDRIGWTCSVCERLLTPETARCGHVIPKTNGGSDALDNRIPLCQTCQCRQASRLPRPSRRASEEISEMRRAA